MGVEEDQIICPHAAVVGVAVGVTPSNLYNSITGREGKA